MNNSAQTMQVFKKLLLALLFVGVTTNAFADSTSTITTDDLRVILPPPVSRSTSAYGTIKNTGDKTDTLLSVSTNAGMIMLHKTDVEGGMAQMNHVNALVIEPGKELILKPMSYHLMFMNVNHDIIKENGEVSITLVFKNAGTIELQVPVKEE